MVFVEGFDCSVCYNLYSLLLHTVKPTGKSVKQQ